MFRHRTVSPAAIRAAGFRHLFDVHCSFLGPSAEDFERAARQAGVDVHRIGAWCHEDSRDDELCLWGVYTR